MITNAGIEYMEKYGGSFVQALATAWCCADPNNKRKLEATFPYYQDYEEQAERREQE